jgi:hypothetical protein
MTRNARALPKFLVAKVGRERIMKAIRDAKLNALDPADLSTVACNPKRQADYFIHQYPNNKAKTQARKKWQAIQDGERAPDPLYSVEDALEKAGL